MTIALALHKAFPDLLIRRIRTTATPGHASAAPAAGAEADSRP